MTNRQLDLAVHLEKHLPFMLRSTELNTFSMTKTIYRDLVCLRGKFCLFIGLVIYSIHKDLNVL